MNLNLVNEITKSQMRNDLPEIKAGMTIRVDVKIKEGNKERIQAFEGIVIKVQGSGIGETFTVRKLSSGVGVERTFPINSPLIDKISGVERTFPINSPLIDKITVIRVGKVRRAKLYYLRSRSGKSARIKEVR